MPSNVRLERSTFEVSRELEFFSEKELQMQIGHDIEWWPVALLKELVDNALDACESADIAPAVEVKIEPDGFSVRDNGPGLPAETIAGSLDYLKRVSDRTFYVSPTRGQLGNALKVVWAAPFVAHGEHGCVEVWSQWRHHTVEVGIDRLAQRPVVAGKPGDPWGTGMVVGHEYVIHEPEAQVIRRVFRLYADGLSSRQIAASLNAEGVVPPGARWRNRTGVRKRTWSHSAIAGASKKGLGILNNEKHAGRLVWNRTTWPRDPERGGKQVRRELPPEKWVIQDVPSLRIVPQELWEAVKARQRQRSLQRAHGAAVPRVPRLLSGIMTCGRCGARFVLRGRHTYCCASRQNRGSMVCDCMATVNAVEAEQAVLNLLELLFCDQAVLARLEAAVRKRLTERRRQRSQQQNTAGQLKAQLAEVEAEIARLVQWIAKGKLVDDLERQMMAAEARRDHLRRELAGARAPASIEGIDTLPGAVRKIVSDLQEMLKAGQVEKVKSALSRLVTSSEVHEDPRQGRKRPGAKLKLKGNLQALLTLTGKVTSGGSPGGLSARLTPTTQVTFRLSSVRGVRRDRLPEAEKWAIRFMRPAALQPCAADSCFA